MEAENEEEMKDLGFIPSAVSDPRWALHMCDNKCTEKGYKLCQIAAVVTVEGGAVHTLKTCAQGAKAIEARRRRGVGFKVEGAGRAEGLSRQAVGSI